MSDPHPKRTRPYNTWNKLFAYLIPWLSARKADDTAPIATIATAGVPAVLAAGTYTYSAAGIDMNGYDSIEFFVYVVLKSTATTVKVVFQEASSSAGTYGWVPAEAAPTVASGDATTLAGRYIVSYGGIDAAGYVVTFQIPFSHRMRSGCYVKLGVTCDAGTPSVYVTYMRKGAS